MATLTSFPRRPAGRCLPPVLIEPVVADPEMVRAMARENGPYFMPARYLVGGGSARGAASSPRGATEVPAAFIGPVFRGDWAFGGQPLVPGADALLHHGPFLDAARTVFGTDVVVPEQVYVNLSAPMPGNAFSHTDIPEFRGIDRTNAPGWLLSAMGASGLFEPERINTVTAVAWFHRGERGYFRYWPDGRDAESVRHEAMWNTAVVGDNDLMHHKVERIGNGDTPVPAGMTLDTELDHDGNVWCISENDRVLASYDDERIRLSLSWKAKVYADTADRERTERGDDRIDLDEALSRFAGALEEPLAANGPEALEDPALPAQLSTVFTSYVPG